MKIIKTGLLSYLAQKDIFEDISISYYEKTIDNDIHKDHWNNWLFDIGLTGYFWKDEVYTENNLWSTLSILKTTNELKIDCALNVNLYRSTYTYDNDKYININKELDFDGIWVKSISEHFSAGFQSKLLYSTFSNYKLLVNIFPSFEYSIYPYSKSTRKQFSILYGIGYSYQNYIETTLFDKEKDELLAHNLSIGMKFIDKWGNLTLGLRGSNYLNNWKYNRVIFSLETQLRIAKGLFFKISGGASMVHDQINLPKSGADYEQVLLQQKEMLSTYYYYFSVGFNFTFGAIQNNIVNPRFTQIF